MITFTQLGKMGRLGNAMLQAAATITHAERNGHDWVFPGDWQYRADFPYLRYSNYIKPNRTYTEPHFHYAEIDKPRGKEVLDLVGYFQGYQYYDNSVRAYLELKNLEWEDGTCSIHCRRGDYVHQPQNHPTQGMDYYEKAMGMVNEKKFLVFSDDIPWCKKHFIGSSFDFAEGQSEMVDMSQMSRCSSHIIANSSFSYVAAWMNPYPEKTVIAPKLWFGPALNHKTDDLCPPEWKRA